MVRSVRRCGTKAIWEHGIGTHKLGICTAYAPPATWHSSNQDWVNVVHVGNDSVIDIRYVVMHCTFAYSYYTLIGYLRVEEGKVIEGDGRGFRVE